MRPSLLLLLLGAPSLVTDGDGGGAVALDVLAEKHLFFVHAAFPGTARGDERVANALDVVFSGRDEHHPATLADAAKVAGVVVAVVRVEAELAELAAFLAGKTLTARDGTVGTHDEGDV